MLACDNSHLRHLQQQGHPGLLLVHCSFYLHNDVGHIYLCDQPAAQHSAVWWACNVSLHAAVQGQQRCCSMLAREES